MEGKGLLDSKSWPWGFHIVVDTPPSLQSCSFTAAGDHHHLPTSRGNERQQLGEVALGLAGQGMPTRDPWGSHDSHSWDNPPGGAQTGFDTHLLGLQVGLSRLFTARGASSKECHLHGRHIC